MNAVPHPAAIERAMSAAQSLVATLDGDDDEVLRADLIDGETDALEIVRRLIRAALDLESMADAAQRRERDLAERRGRFEASAERARETAKAMLDALGVHRVQTEDFTVSLKLGPPKIVVTEPDALDDEFVRIKRDPDKPLIRAALDAGREVRGAMKSNGSIVLAVRTK